MKLHWGNSQLALHIIPHSILRISATKMSKKSFAPVLYSSIPRYTLTQYFMKIISFMRKYYKFNANEVFLPHHA